MNKNLLIKQNNELFSRINLLKNNNSALNSKVAQLTAEVEAYKQKIASLENELQLLKTEKSKPITALEIEEITEISDAPETTQKEDATEKEKVELPAEFNFASGIIGNIVIKAASTIEKINESSNDNKKELINLILGRTEIAKAEILSIISSDVSFESKQELINTQFDDANEYFKSILEQ